MTEHSLDELIAMRKKELGAILKQVERLMQQEDLYRDSGLTLDKVAARLGITRNRLSEAMNCDGEQGFKKYLIGWRVKYTIREIVKGRGGRVDVQWLWKDAGFGSRTSFYDSFKNITGLSPAEFYKGRLNETE